MEHYTVLRTQISENTNRQEALEKLLDLAISADQKIPLALPAVGLLRALRDVISEDNGNCRDISLSILNNLASMFINIYISIKLSNRILYAFYVK